MQRFFLPKPDTFQDQLVGLREKQQTQLTELQAAVDEKHAALDVEVGKRDQLSALASVEFCKTDYVREMSKLLEALKHAKDTLQIDRPWPSVH